MSASRREFLAGLAAASLLSRFSVASYAELRATSLYPSMDLSYFDTPLHRGPSEIKIGYAAITWGGKDTQAIEDISSLGYPGIQLRANVIKDFPDPHALRDLLAQHKLTFVALSSGTATLDPAVRQSTIDEHVKNAKYMKEAGGRYLQVVGGSSKGHPYGAADYTYEGLLLTEIGKRVAEYGIQTGFHNHMDTIGQKAEAVDAILDAADAKYVKLELDTAHYAQGGGDPVAAIRKYAKRLLFLHLKDVKANTTSSGYEFAELGTGTVDFPAIFEALKSVHFRGWGIIELDGERPGADRTPRQSAEISKAFLKDKIGVQV